MAVLRLHNDVTLVNSVEKRFQLLRSPLNVIGYRRRCGKMTKRDLNRQWHERSFVCV